MSLPPHGESSIAMSELRLPVVTRCTVSKSYKMVCRPVYPHWHAEDEVIYLKSTALLDQPSQPCTVSSSTVVRVKSRDSFIDAPSSHSVRNLQITTSDDMIGTMLNTSMTTSALSLLFRPLNTVYRHSNG